VVKAIEGPALRFNLLSAALAYNHAE